MLTAGHILQQRFLIERVLGQGGMGAVYLARHLALGNRSMAIKEMTIDIADTEKRNQAVAQFLKEAQILAGLDHPNLVRVQDFFEEEGRQYLVMDYVEGKNLEDTMIEYDGFLPVERVVAWGRQIADVLQYLHTRQPPVLFRDLKPTNILLNGRDQIRLIDFGIARVLDPSSHTSTFIHGAGTSGFAPIEQYTGNTDPRTDIYALGATLYTLLTRSIPPMSIAMMTGEAPLTPPRVLNPSLTPPLEAWLLKMMALQKENRYASAAEASTALEEALRPGAPTPCSKCGQPLMMGAQFCGECGERVAPLPPLVSVSTIKPPAISESTLPVENRSPPTPQLPPTQPAPVIWSPPDRPSAPDPKWSALPPQPRPPPSNPGRPGMRKLGSGLMALAVFLTYKALHSDGRGAPPVPTASVEVTETPRPTTPLPREITLQPSRTPPPPSMDNRRPPPPPPGLHPSAPPGQYEELERVYSVQQRALQSGDLDGYMNTLSRDCVFKLANGQTKHWSDIRSDYIEQFKNRRYLIADTHTLKLKQQGSHRVVLYVRNHLVIQYNCGGAPRTIDGTGWDTWERGSHGWKQIKFEEEGTQEL